MKTPDLIASRLVDGPNPADRTLPLIDADAADGRDFLTVTRKVYRGLVAAAVREALAERDAEVAKLRNQVAGFEHVQDLWNKGMESTCDNRNALNQQVRDLRAENAALREQVAGHCERISKQSELLSRRAERPEAAEANAPK